MAALKPFAIIARRAEKSQEKRNKDISLLKEVGKYEVEQDQCGAYLSLVAHEGDKTPITIFESYDSKDYLLDDVKGHRSSEPYKKFKKIETDEAMLDKPTEIAFYETKFGFIQRDDVPSVPLENQFIWIAKLTAQPGKRSEIVEACRVHAGNVERTEKETFSFMVLESTDNDEDLLLFERYSSEKYFKDVHFVSDSMKEYREKIAAVLANRDSSGFSVVAGFLDKRETLL